MRVKYKHSDEELKEMRQKAYLASWPVERQLEALTEAQAGRPDKLKALGAYIKSIKTMYPYSTEEQL